MRIDGFKELQSTKQFFSGQKANSRGLAITLSWSTRHVLTAQVPGESVQNMQVACTPPFANTIADVTVLVVQSDLIRID